MVFGFRRTVRRARPYGERRGGGGRRVLSAAVALFATAALGLAAAGPAHAGLDGPLATNYDQHCLTNVVHIGSFVLLQPVDRVTVVLEAVDHDPADQSVQVTYAVPGKLAATTLTGHFDPALHNVSFTFDIPFPPAAGTLTLTSAVTWADNTAFSDQFSSPVLGCGTVSTAGDTSTWNNFVATTATQTCGTQVLRLGSTAVRLPYDRVTVTVAQGAPYNASMLAGDSFWTGYWVTGGSQGTTAYTSGTTGTIGANGAPATVTYTIFFPPASGELNLLTSVRSGTRTFPAHLWMPIAC